MKVSDLIIELQKLDQNSTINFAEFDSGYNKYRYKKHVYIELDEETCAYSLYPENK